MQQLIMVCLGLLALVGANECPGGGRCGAGQTCCNPTGVSGGQLCCPAGQRCSADGRSCIREGVAWCDSTGYCPDGTTCCKSTTGDWTCCPFQQAVCCDDHEHCCPTGTTCDLATLTCEHHSGSMPMLRKNPAVRVKALRYRVEMEEQEEEEERGAGAVIPCDDHTACEDSYTCCFMKSIGKWGCCPLPEAVCCPDGQHCCPTGYKCSEHDNSCTSGNVALPWYTKIPAIRREREDHVESALLTSPQLRDVPCDEQKSCRDGETCCRISATEWGCCPLPKAVCCSDMQHCCPAGTTCTAAGECVTEPRLYWHN